MPRKPPTSGQWKPGQSGNPLGAAAHDPKLKAIRKLTKESIADIGAMILDADLEALQAVAKDKKASVLKVWYASIAVKAISRGDAAALNLILNRIVGKVPEDIRLAGADGGPVQYQDLTFDQAQDKASEILERIKKRGKPV